MKKRTKYESKYIKANRTFPVGNTILLILIVAVQIGLICFAIFYQPKPQDRIRQYNVSVEPLDDGSLDIEYQFVWEALDTSEELTWVEIGMANEHFAVYSDCVSDNVASFEKYTDDDYVSLQLYFKDAYIGGDVIAFSFKVNQKNMLCQNDSGYFFEFIPGWFNSIQVEQYEFRWHMENRDDYIQRGSLDYGEYGRLFVQYGQDEFSGCNTVNYIPFNGDGAYNSLQEDKVMVAVLCGIVAALLIIAEVYIVDSYVSYGRGRGFLTGYGHHIHTYGRSNPRYRKARDKHTASTGGRLHGGSGCACACACACAGGGRAGCSQKDTYGNRESFISLRCDKKK